MSGHSKWHNIQKTKGAADAKRAQAFTKIAREIIVAVKEGGSGDPANNSRLATVIAKAKAANMPNDNIKRTIEKALGSGNADNFERVTYEGYGPSGVAIIVDAMTDNRNRTASEVRHHFDKYGGNLGATGCVSWSFDEKGVIVVDNEDEEIDEDTIMLSALEAGADDVFNDAAATEIYTLEEVEAIFAALETEPLKYKTFIILAVYSGFYRGEMLGLEWKDIDWDNNVISVKRTSNYTGKANGIYTDTTKTKKSQRSIKFPPIVMEMLRQFKAEQDSDREQTGDKWVDTDRLFVKRNGLPMHNNTPYFWFSEFCKKHGFRFCDIHSLRHLHCSLLINAGIDVVSVSADLGHSCVGTTVNTPYGHTHHSQPYSITKQGSESF
jgi:YebC/PmpR family DNA-binding regulatory protein